MNYCPLHAYAESKTWLQRTDFTVLTLGLKIAYLALLSKASSLWLCQIWHCVLSEVCAVSGIVAMCHRKVQALAARSIQFIAIEMLKEGLDWL